jgi:hypothetical protein
MTYSCQFCDTGFFLNGFQARPCRTRYHVGCISVGPPFLTRLQARKGLYCPRDLARQRHFVCEACTVRAVRKSELGFFAWDFALLMLERVRMVDISNKWAASTLKGYQSKYNVFSEFDRTFHLTSLLATRPSHPPCGPSIPLMWTQEWYMLFPANWRRKNPLRERNITFGTGRGLRSAASHFWILDLLYTHPENLTTGFKDRPTFVEQRCSPTDELHGGPTPPCWRSSKPFHGSPGSPYPLAQSVFPVFVSASLYAAPTVGCSSCGRYSFDVLSRLALSFGNLRNAME